MAKLLATSASGECLGERSEGMHAGDSGDANREGCARSWVHMHGKLMLAQL